MSTAPKNLWRNADFMRLWTGQTASLFGSEVSLLALPLTAVLTLDASGVEMGALFAAGSIPAIVPGIVAGALVDRVARRPVLVLTDLGRAVLLCSIPLVYLAGWLSVWYLCAAAFLIGVLTTFFDIAHMSLLPTLVHREHLVDGNSKLELSRSGAMIVGPGVAGALVEAITAPIALIVDAVSFLVSALVIQRIRTPESAKERPDLRPGLVAEIREGYAIVLRSPLLRAMAGSLCVFNLFSAAFNAVYLLFVTRELSLSPGTLGLVFGVGSLSFPLGAIAAKWLSDRIGVGPAIVWGAGIADAAFLLAPLAAGQAGVSIVMLVASRFLATLGGPVTAINQLSLRQSITPDRLQGRVNGTMRVLSLSLLPVGALAGGVLGEMIGLRPALLLSALGMQVGFVILYLSPLRQTRDAPATQLAG